MAENSGNDKKTVWVLGSGFSRALGGPLLKQLLSESALLELQLAHPSLDGRREFKEVQETYAYGLRSGFWEDAETFLDRLDVAGRESNSGPGRQMRIAYNNVARSVLPPDGPDVTRKFASLSGEARRFVALQCARFTDSYDEGLESWQAYRFWFKKIWHLGPIHRIVSFNYDWVLERLDAEIPTPSQAASQDWEYYQDLPGATVRCLKLHGSVGWKKTGVDSYEPAPENWNLYDCDSSEIAIAAPGPTKHESVKGPLRFLWAAAREAIEQADSIVFIGYRFPPTDAEARSRLLDAIGRNKAKELSLNIVLGPSLGSDDNVRLKALLRYTVINRGRIEMGNLSQNMVLDALENDRARFSIIEHPLLAEDFLTVWEPRLTGSV